MWKKVLVVAGESNPGPLALATSALATELQQPSTLDPFKGESFNLVFMKGQNLVGNYGKGVYWTGEN